MKKTILFSMGLLGTVSLANGCNSSTGPSVPQESAGEAGSLDELASGSKELPPNASQSPENADRESNPGTPERADGEITQDVPGDGDGGSAPAAGQDITDAPSGGVPQTPPAPAPAPPQAQVFPANCKEILAAQAGAPNGVYSIYLDAQDPTKRKEIQAFCNMSSDGGGWTMFLNYVHLANTNPPLNVRSETLPLFGSNTLGVDESTSANFWGHAGNALLKRFTFTELRFFCKSSRSTSVVAFQSSDPGCLTAAREGRGTCLNVRQNKTFSVGHTASLPNSITKATTDKGDFVLTDTTFASELRGDPNPADISWSIRGGAFQAWECDFGSNSNDSNTIHRMFFR